MWWLAVIGFSLFVSFARPADGQRLPTSTTDRVVLRSDGNELTAMRTAPVSYRSLAALSGALLHPLPVPSRVLRLVRTAPPEVVEYTLCVTREGTLVFGEQRFEVEAPGRQRVLVRGELGRGYTPLEQDGPWTWLVGLPLSREVQVTLHVRATTSGWPVRSVTIDVVGTR
jgi:hypothetical protein